MQAELIATVPCQCTLGEGILWDARLGAFLWTDIHACALHTYHLESGEHTVLPLPRRLASFALTPDSDTLLAAFDDRIATLHRVSGTVADLIVPPLLSGVRFNDGRTDPEGRFWVGTMVEDAAAAGAENRGELFSLDPSGALSVHRGGIAISNGIAFSPDGTRMYFADSPTRRVIHRPTSAHYGAGQADTSFLTTDPGAFPDGAVTSADGRYWSANWGAGLIRVTHADGTDAGRLPVPASQPSCCAFGGRDLSILAVTSAREDLTPAALAAEPDAGNVFLYQTDAAGLPSVPYAGPLN